MRASVSEARRGTLASNRALAAIRIKVSRVFTDVFIMIFLSFFDLSLFTDTEVSSPP
jgi:hypothetical protein